MGESSVRPCCEFGRVPITTLEGGENSLARTREKKERLVNEYGERVARAQVMIWAQYRGIRVSQMEQLRGRLRGVGAEMVVIKNTLMRVALEQANLPRDPEVMGGPCAVTFAYDDVGAAARAVTDFARANPSMYEIKGGLVAGEVVDSGRIIFLSRLPPRDVLLAQVVGGIQAPISGLVGALAAIIRSLSYVLNARKDQLEAAPG